jgi:WD40 repeat protein
LRASIAAPTHDLSGDVARPQCFDGGNKRCGFLDAVRSTLSTIAPMTGETIHVGSIHGDVTSAPGWSPDGTRFVFGARGGMLYSLDVRSGADSLLVRLPGEHLDSVDLIAWSPDGAHIAVMNDLGLGGGRLYVMGADGSNVRVLAGDFDSMGVAWSPDGTRLAYADGSGSDRNVRIWVAPMDGSPPTQIGSLPVASCDALNCDHDLAWSPDGSRVAFRTAGGGLVDLVGSTLVQRSVVWAIAADGSGDAERIDELTYRSWDDGWYSCEC